MKSKKFTGKIYSVGDVHGVEDIFVLLFRVFSSIISLTLWENYGPFWIWLVCHVTESRGAANQRPAFH